MKYCLILGNNFEDVEAIAPIDILRRAAITVDIYGVGSDVITGRSNVPMKTERVFREERDIVVADYDGILLPGGPGVGQLLKNEALISIIQKFFAEKKLLFAICAAPLLLEKAGVLKGKRFTCFPGEAPNIKSGIHLDEKVVVDGNIITSQGLGTSIDAGLKLVEIIKSPEEAKTMAQKILYSR